MSTQEQSPISEATPQMVYSKATEILDIHGIPGEDSIVIKYTSETGRTKNETTEVPITQSPIIPVQIGDKEYRLWLKSVDSKLDNPNGTIELSIHFQAPTYGLESVERDDEGNVTSYWLKPEGDSPQLEHVIVTGEERIPKELRFDWYMARGFFIKPDSILKNEDPIFENVPLDITERLGDESKFINALLDHMKKHLEASPTKT